MKVLVTGVCGFVGNAIVHCLRMWRSADELQIVGLDNLSRAGSELNRRPLSGLGVSVHHGDVRLASDLEHISGIDWVIDAAANPSVLAGLDGRTSSRQILDHNLSGTVNLLEHCRKQNAGLILLSTSRVYSIQPLAALDLEVVDHAYRPVIDDGAPFGVTAAGVDERFSTAAPISLYGATKLASEVLALEYHHTFGVPIWINRCGVIAGAGQFGHMSQGIFSYWINAHLRRRPLKYVGFDGKGHQVRDCLHPFDLASLVLRQLECADKGGRPLVANVSGGVRSAMSLAQLTEWCDERFGPHHIEADLRSRAFDIPWLVLHSSVAEDAWSWQPEITSTAILEEIARHAEQHPDWLEISEGVA